MNRYLPYLLGMRGARGGVSRYMYDDDPVPAPAFSCVYQADN